ncbi:MAG TPA: hypothetical protein VKU60_01375 [Chloroflexota bacterium]|nr:hypothetical protein [Chloroflexota bacterium]
MKRLTSTLAFLAAWLIAPVLTASAAGPPEAPSCSVFPASNVWNADVSALPVHPQSAGWLASANAGTKRLHPDFGGPPYGMPWIAVDNSHPVTSLAFDYADESDPGPYPFDPNTPIEGGQTASGDRHALMLNRDTCKLYELYDANWSGGAPTAGSGAIFDLTSNVLRPATWTSADAAGLPIFPGLVRYDELQAGAITHAIRFTVQRTDKSFIWPARHQAGDRHDPNLPPMGARFRLKSGFDASAYSPQARIVITALQRYGLILADNGSDWFFQGTADPRWTDTLLDQLKRIPASQFEAVDESSLMVDPNSGAVKQPGSAQN